LTELKTDWPKIKLKNQLKKKQGGGGGEQKKLTESHIVMLETEMNEEKDNVE